MELRANALWMSRVEPEGEREPAFAAIVERQILQSSSDPHADLNTEEQRRILYAALQDLPEKERTAIILRDIEGLSTAEVAQILGSAEATVRSQISTARLKIRKAVKRE